MANNITEIITKIVLRNDILTAWEASKLVLEKGEPALEMDMVKGSARIKIGDGIRTFKELPYSTVTQEDVQNMINESMTEAGSINSVSLTSGTNKGTLKLTINGIEYDNISVTGLGSAAYTDASNYATAEQGQRAEIAMVYKGVTSVLPINSIEIGDTYSVISDFTVTADYSGTGEDINVTIGDTIIADMNKKWLVKPAGAAETAKSLTEGISAQLSGGVVGSASASANAGETIDINVTEVNMDYLVQGTKTIILNGGNASVE